MEQNRLIFGRSPNALIALFSIGFNLLVAVLQVYFHTTTDPIIIGGVNGFFGALVLYVSGNDNIQLQAGSAALDRTIAKQGGDVNDPDDPSI